MLRAKEAARGRFPGDDHALISKMMADARGIHTWKSMLLHSRPETLAGRGGRECQMDHGRSIREWPTSLEERS